MGTVKIFYKDDCPMCPLAKRLKDNLQENNVNVHYYNVETTDGLARSNILTMWMALQQSLSKMRWKMGFKNGGVWYQKWMRLWLCNKHNFPIKGL